MTLPEGFGVALADSVRRYAGGRVLAGGSPYRVVRLSDAGLRALDQLEHGRSTSPAARGLARRLIDEGLASPVPAQRLRSPSVTVVIPVRDRAQELDACLRSLCGSDAVVIDDASIDAEAVAAAARRHGARLMRLRRSRGPAAARNAGLESVDTELVAFLDSDCVAPPGWLERLGRHFADPRVGVVAPRVTPGRILATSATSGMSATSARSAISAASTSGAASVRERYAASRSPLDLGPAATDVGPGRPVAYVPAAALVLRTAALCGGFDERLRYGEDVDLVWRVRAAGWTVRYDPTVVVSHGEPSSWRGLLRRRYRYGTSAAPLSRRHPGMLAPAIVSRRQAAAAGLAFAGHPGLALALAISGPLSSYRRLIGAGLPAPMIPALGMTAAWRTTLGLSRAATTLALPALLAGLAPRRTRAAAAFLLAAGPLTEYLARRPALDPFRWTAVAIADDAVYGAGVWRGCLRWRTADPLAPRIARATASI